MFSATRSTTAMALRGMQFSTPRTGRPLTIFTARPATALLPFRGAQAAFISSSSSKKAEPATIQRPALVAGNPGTPPPMKVSAKMDKDVVLPSQEGKQGVMQYALYVVKISKEHGISADSTQDNS